MLLADTSTTTTNKCIAGLFQWVLKALLDEAEQYQESVNNSRENSPMHKSARSKQFFADSVLEGNAAGAGAGDIVADDEDGAEDGNDSESDDFEDEDNENDNDGYNISRKLLDSQGKHLATESNQNFEIEYNLHRKNECFDSLKLMSRAVPILVHHILHCYLTVSKIK